MELLRNPGPLALFVPGLRVGRRCAPTADSIRATQNDMLDDGAALSDRVIALTESC
jgi:hypothetical protein